MRKRAWKGRFDARYSTGGSPVIPAMSSYAEGVLRGGRLPVSVTGTLRTQNGVGQFDIESAAISGVPVPTTFLQELLSYYSRTPERPQGVRLDAPFTLPARIQQIEVGKGQAVVVQ